MDNMNRIDPDDINERVRQSHIVQPIAKMAALANDLIPRDQTTSKTHEKPAEGSFDAHLDTEIANLDSPENVERIKQNYVTFKATKDAAYLENRRQKAKQAREDSSSGKHV